MLQTPDGEGAGAVRWKARHRRKVDEEAELVARIYLEAVATGSRAPTMAVAHTMNRSRVQASRYVRRARELGLPPTPGPQQEG